MIEKTTQNVLLIFSNKEKIELLKSNFQAEHFQVTCCSSGEDAIEIVQKINPALIVIDVDLGGMDGIVTCQTIRNQLNLVDPVIVFLTDRNEDYTQIAAYEAGADDFLPILMKPRLLLSKVNTLLNRKDLCCSPNKNILSGPLIIDRSKFSVHYLDREFILPKKEFCLLEALAGVQGKVVNREQLMQMVWKDKLTVGDRTIDVHIRKIREKISKELIRTIKGVGYQLNVGAIIK